MSEAMSVEELDARDQRIAKLIRDGVSHRQIAGQFNTSCSEVTRVRAALGMKRGEMVHRQPAQPATPVVKPLRVKLHLAPMKPEEQFKCEHFACTLTARACVLRQGQRISVRGGKEGHNRFVGKEQRVSLEFQYCANECVQGPAVKEALGGAKVEPPRKVDFQAQYAARRAAMRPEFAPATFADAEIETEPAIPPAEEKDEDDDGRAADVRMGIEADARRVEDLPQKLEPLSVGANASGAPGSGRQLQDDAAVHLHAHSAGRSGALAPVSGRRAGHRLEHRAVAKPNPPLHAPGGAPPSRPAGRLRARSPAAHCRGDTRAAAHREAGAPPVSAPRQQVFWNCGCGRTFQARGFGMHRRGCLFRCAAWPLVIVPPPPQPEDLRAR